MQAGDSATGHGRNAALDGLRALAIALVVGFHSQELLPGGSIGVTVFFVLSGYLITGILVRPGTLRVPGLWRFYVRRFLRLFPALFVVCLFCFGWALVVLDGAARDRLLTLVATAVTYTQDFHLGQGATAPDGSYLGHAWSLAVEEQFYLLWPLLLLGLRRVSASPVVQVVAMVELLALATLWRAHLIDEGLAAHVGYGIDAHADSLIIGCILALGLPLARGWLEEHQGLLDAATAVALVWVLGFAAGPFREWFGGVVDHLLVGLASAVVICRLVLPVAGGLGAAVLRAFTWRPVVVLGLWSYSLYLWHVVVLDIARRDLGVDAPREIVLAAPVLAVALLGTAWASYTFVEQPFQRLKDRWAEQPGPAPAVLPSPEAEAEVRTGRFARTPAALTRNR